MAALAPLFLKPRLDSRLWGGSRIGPWLGIERPPEQLAEAWLVYDENEITAGPGAGGSLRAAAATLGAALIGERTRARFGEGFPLLAKVIDARDRLSVQVHPDDAYARAHETGAGAFGKTEAWHILERDPGADVFLGFNRDTSRDELKQRALDGTVTELLRRVPVQPGQTLFVPAGTVHGINGGVLLFEIQQRSDFTYRLFDYGRLDAEGKPRALHLEQALAVTRLQAGSEAPATPAAALPWATSLVDCPYFALERWEVAGNLRTATDRDSFELLVPISGPVTLQWKGGEAVMARGAAAVLPAALGEYSLGASSAQVLRCYVPNDSAAR